MKTPEYFILADGPNLMLVANGFPRGNVGRKRNAGDFKFEASKRIFKLDGVGPALIARRKHELINEIATITLRCAHFASKVTDRASDVLARLQIKRIYGGAPLIDVPIPLGPDGATFTVKATGVVIEVVATPRDASKRFGSVEALKVEYTLNDYAEPTDAPPQRAPISALPYNQYSDVGAGDPNIVPMGKLLRRGAPTTDPGRVLVRGIIN